MAENHTAFCTAEEFVTTEYDFLIVGGGTAGACVAARLSEDRDCTVGVIEAGENLMDDPNVSTPSLYPAMIGLPKYDWCFSSTPQANAGAKVYSMPRGKLLGGSSGINYLMYCRPSSACIDAWVALGNRGWGWRDLLPYFKKHETMERSRLRRDSAFMPVDPNEAAEYHGTDGPIHVSFNDWHPPFEQDFCEAAYAVTGRPSNIKDAWSGDHMGFFSSLGVVNRSTDRGKRSYSATGYLRPNLSRQNLRVLTSSHVTKIVLDGTRALGVEFVSRGQSYSARCREEVIISAGAIQSPQILELSGIGKETVLERAGIKPRIRNDAIGANFQDHVLSGLLFDLRDDVATSPGALQDSAEAHKQTYMESGTGPYGSPGMLMGFVSYSSVGTPAEVAATVVQARDESQAATPFERKREQLVLDQLSRPEFANLQTFCLGGRLDVSKGSDQTQFFAAHPAGKQQVSLLMCLEHPLSRGSVHVRSSDPFQQPEIDPGYFGNPVDAKVLAAGIKWIDQVSKHPTFARHVARRELPPAESDILDTEGGRIEYLKNHISTQYHLIGTCAMGEAVTDRLLVKGTANIRVVDASVFPAHVSGNILATTYAVAEKGADLIKEDRNKRRTKL
jgi:choline dehydrogenase-like flavoprotein